MNKTFILIFFIINLSFGQSIQHEPRKVFVITLNVPQNIRNSNKAFEEFALKNNLKQLLCFRDGQISSEINFDKNGNVISKIENDNKVVNKSEFNYDDRERITKILYYSPNGKFVNGYDYKYDGPYKTEYKIGDSIPITRTIELEDENITIYSDYNENKKWELSSVYFKFSNGEYDRELRYNQDGLYRESKYFYNQTKLEGGTKTISYHKGIKVHEKDVSFYKTDKNGNRTEKYSAYSTDTLKLVSSHKFNDRNQVLENNYPTNLENFEYDPDGIILKKIIKDRNGITTLNFFYQNTLLEKVEKVNKEIKVTFRYEYEFFE